MSERRKDDFKKVTFTDRVEAADVSIRKQRNAKLVARRVGIVINPGDIGSLINAYQPSFILNGTPAECLYHLDILVKILQCQQHYAFEDAIQGSTATPGAIMQYTSAMQQVIARVIFLLATEAEASQVCANILCNLLYNENSTEWVIYMFAPSSEILPTLAKHIVNESGGQLLSSILGCVFNICIMSSQHRNAVISSAIVVKLLSLTPTTGILPDICHTVRSFFDATPLPPPELLQQFWPLMMTVLNNVHPTAADDTQNTVPVESVICALFDMAKETPMYRRIITESATHILVHYAMSDTTRVSIREAALNTLSFLGKEPANLDILAAANVHFALLTGLAHKTNQTRALMGLVFFETHPCMSHPLVHTKLFEYIAKSNYNLRNAALHIVARLVKVAPDLTTWLEENVIVALFGIFQIMGDDTATQIAGCKAFLAIFENETHGKRALKQFKENEGETKLHILLESSHVGLLRSLLEELIETYF